MLKDEYNAMFVENHDEERNQSCPPELTRTKILKVDGFECKVFYNYVPPYTYGVKPLNCWWGLTVVKYRGKTYNWKCPLRKEVESLEEACSIIHPIFAKAIKRMKVKCFEKGE